MEHRRHAKARLKKPNSVPKSQVADHFSTDGHNLSHMKVAGIFHVGNETRRLIEEGRLIAKMGSYRAEGMNIDFDFANLS